jgi:hypothetical protein
MIMFNRGENSIKYCFTNYSGKGKWNIALQMCPFLLRITESKCGSGVSQVPKLTCNLLCHESPLPNLPLVNPPYVPLWVLKATEGYVRKSGSRIGCPTACALQK